MAVISVTKAFGDSATQDEKGIVERQYFNVRIDPTDTPLIAFGAVDPITGLTVPSHYDQHSNPAYPTMRVSSVNPERAGDDKSPLLRVAVEYRPNVAEKPNMTKWNKRVSSAGVEVVERVNKNTDGNPILNAVGDLYQADTEVVRYDELLTVAYNTRLSDTLAALGRSRGLLNDAAVTLNITRWGVTYTETFPEKTLKLGNATWNIDIGSDGTGFFNIEIPMIHRVQKDSDGNEIGWAYQIPDRGERYKSSAGDIVKSNSGIVDLAADGKKLADGDPQHMLVEDMLETCDFSAFLDGI